MESGGVKPNLLHKLEGSTNEIHAAVIIPGMECGGLSKSSDKLILSSLQSLSSCTVQLRCASYCFPIEKEGTQDLPHMHSSTLNQYKYFKIRKITLGTR